MAHFAEIDKNNKVLRVVVVNDSDVLKDKVEDEATGIAFCNKLLGGNWIQTSYNGKIRKRFAGIGYTYDKERDAFISPRIYKSWSLDKNGDWQPPVPCPDDKKTYTWDEMNLKWVEIKAIFTPTSPDTGPIPIAEVVLAAEAVPLKSKP